MLPSSQDSDHPIRIPPNDTSLDGVSIFLLDHEDRRYESELPVVNSAHDAIVLSKSTSATRSGLSKVYMAPGCYDYPLGNIVKPAPSDVPRVAAARPFLLVFRSLSVGFFNPSENEVAAATAYIGDREHVIVQERRVSPRWTLWADPARNFTITRYALSNDRRERVRADIQYAEHHEHGWVPIGWTIVERDADGSLVQSTSSVVELWEINVPIAPEQFDVEFPPDTLVRDFTNESGDGTVRQYILRAGGEQRLVAANERSATYWQLLNSNSGEALIPSTSPSWPTVLSLIVTSVVFLTCLLILVRRWRNRNRFQRDTAGARAIEAHHYVRL